MLFKFNMDEPIIAADGARNSAPERDTARHPLTIKKASLLFAERGVPRAPRSVQRFCEHGYLDCIRVKGAKGDQFFINQQSVERYAEELRQIEVIATIDAEARHDAPERDRARNSAPERDKFLEPSRTEREPEAGSPAIVERLEDEILNLRIDNRAKEQVISMLSNERREMQTQLQEISYRLGATEARVAQLDTAKGNDDNVRHSAPEPATDRTEAAIPIPTPSEPSDPERVPSTATPDPVAEPPRQSFLARLLG